MSTSDEMVSVYLSVTATGGLGGDRAVSFTSRGGLTFSLDRVEEAAAEFARELVAEIRAQMKKGAP